jgi:hypothetical protein
MVAMKIEFWLVDEGDWIDVFLDGKKVHGDHQIQYRELLEVLKPYLPKDLVVETHYWHLNEEENQYHNGYIIGAH